MVLPIPEEGTKRQEILNDKGGNFSNSSRHLYSPQATSGAKLDQITLALALIEFKGIQRT